MTQPTTPQAAPARRKMYRPNDAIRCVIAVGGEEPAFARRVVETAIPWHGWPRKGRTHEEMLSVVGSALTTLRVQRNQEARNG